MQAYLRFVLLKCNQPREKCCNLIGRPTAAAEQIQDKLATRPPILKEVEPRPTKEEWVMCSEQLMFESLSREYGLKVMGRQNWLKMSR